MTYNVPEGSVRERTDETFYVVHGELECLDGGKMFTASASDVVFLPRGTVHRLRNPGIQPARLVFIYTPGGVESVFAEGGDEPQPGVGVKLFDPPMSSVIYRSARPVPAGQDNHGEASA
jgi:glyoxylate utilization-related uncharacterized protein